ncbi:hypothetical protein OF83DRAFT_676611 [Amylostereum chailletii]|nr:hypothetical protein OF83DRAFT_676611 [Amylostereum chailletii]
MASKRLGRLRQWAGEVISLKDKSSATEETKELEQDIEIRRDGLRRIQLTATEFHHNIAKKKVSEALEEDEKFAPRDALGIIMITHGEEFGEESPYGASLAKLGQAHCKIATLQAAFALTLQSTYLVSLDRCEEEIKEYDVERKQLETRRINYDAALARMEKATNSKKDKDRKEAEDELAKAKTRYEDAVEDIRARVVGIQENEIDQLRDLTTLLDAELNFAQQYAEILKDVKATWSSQADMSRLHARRPVGPLHDFSRSVDHETPPIRSASVRSHKSKGSTSSFKRHPRPEDESSDEDEDDETDDDRSRKPSSRRSSVYSSKSKAGSRPPSRPASRTSRKRSDSTATIGENDKEKEKMKHKSISGWTSSWRGKKDKNQLFSALQDDENPEGTSTNSSSLSFTMPSMPSIGIGKSRSVRTTPSASPSIPSRGLNMKNLDTRKHVRALYDFSGSSDELSFHVGDRIVVVNEVLDDWWMGELNGRQGLFPTTHTEVVSPSSSPTKLRPVLPPRPNLASTGSFSESSSKQTLVEDDHLRSDDEAHPFGDHQARNLRSIYSPMSSQFSYDTDSITDSMLEDDQTIEQHALVPKKGVDDDEFGPPGDVVKSVPPPPPRRPSESRKAPPPPPPRRSHTSTPSTTHTPLLEAPPLIGPSLSDQPAIQRHASPFKRAMTLPDGETGDCQEFLQNPFKARGMCSNCYRMHNV